MSNITNQVARALTSRQIHRCRRLVLEELDDFCSRLSAALRGEIEGNGQVLLGELDLLRRMAETLLVFKRCYEVGSAQERAVRSFQAAWNRKVADSKALRLVMNAAALILE